MEMKSNSDGLRHGDNSAKTKEGAKENPPGTIKHEVGAVFFTFFQVADFLNNAFSELKWSFQYIFFW